VILGKSPLGKQPLGKQPPAAPPAGFQAAWANSSNKIIGAQQ